MEREDYMKETYYSLHNHTASSNARLIDSINKDAKQQVHNKIKETISKKTTRTGAAAKTSLSKTWWCCLQT